MINKMGLPDSFDPSIYHKQGATVTINKQKRIELVQRLLSGRTKLKTLDFGCGFGDITYLLSKDFDNICGTDVDPVRIDWANKEFPSIEYVLSYEDKTMYEDSLFENIISIAVINWVDNPDNHLAEIKRLLVNDGCLALIVAYGGNPYVKYFKKLLRMNDEYNFWFEDIDSMQVRLVNAGFDVIKSDSFYESYLEYSKDMRGYISFLMSLPFRLLKLKRFAPYYGILASVKKNG